MNYDGPERRKSGPCPLTNEQGYEILFTQKKILEDIKEIKSSKDILELKEAIKKLEEKVEDTEKKKYAGKIVLAVGGCIVYAIGWGFDHIKNFKEVIGVFMAGNVIFTTDKNMRYIDYCEMKKIKEIIISVLPEILLVVLLLIIVLSFV